MASKISIKEFEENFEFVKDLGQGTFGKVYQYRNKQNQKLVAVKKTISTDFEQLSTSLQELTLLSGAIHKNIIRIFHYCMVKEEVGKLPGQDKSGGDTYSLYMFMELGDYSLDFEIMERFKSEHCFSERSLFYLLYDLSSGLAYMQSINLSHRDIKPHNILKINGVYKVTDFGVSKPKLNKTISNTLTGSPPYLSPQLFQNFENGVQKVVANSYKSDCFSLGLVVLGCALLKDITGCNKSEEFKNQMIEKVEQTQRYGKWLIKILRELLKFDEKERIDFIQLQQLLIEMKTNPSEYGLQFFKNQKKQKSVKIQSKSGSNSLENSKQSNQNQPDITMDSLNISDQENSLDLKNQKSLFHRLNTQVNYEESIKHNNQSLTQTQAKVYAVNQKLQDQMPKFVMIDDEEESKLLIGLSTAQTFDFKKKKLLEDEKKNYQFPEGSYYGDIDENNIRTGVGKFLTKDGKFFYQGEWKNDFMEGVGLGIWQDGKKYQGQWKQSKRHGYGELNYKNGDVFRGQFKNDEKHGEGEFIYNSDERYIGQYKYGERCGEGQYEYNDGSTYIGEWKNNMKNGFGKIINLKQDVVYEGQFKNNCYHGYGKLLLKNKIYEGNFQNNIMEGQFKAYKRDQEEDYQTVQYSKGKLVE